MTLDSTSNQIGLSSTIIRPEGPLQLNRPIPEVVGNEKYKSRIFKNQSIFHTGYFEQTVDDIIAKLFELKTLKLDDPKKDLKMLAKLLSQEAEDINTKVQSCENRDETITVQSQNISTISDKAQGIIQSESKRRDSTPSAGMSTVFTSQPSVPISISTPIQFSRAPNESSSKIPNEKLEASPMANQIKAKPINSLLPSPTSQPFPLTSAPNFIIPPIPSGILANLPFTYPLDPIFFNNERAEEAQRPKIDLSGIMTSEKAKYLLTTYGVRPISSTRSTTPLTALSSLVRNYFPHCNDADIKQLFKFEENKSGWASHFCFNGINFPKTATFVKKYMAENEAAQLALNAMRTSKEFYKNFLIKIPPDTDRNPTSTLLQFQQMHSIYKGDELQGIYKFIGNVKDPSKSYYECGLTFRKIEVFLGTGDTKRQAREVASRGVLRKLQEAIDILSVEDVQQVISTIDEEEKKLYAAEPAGSKITSDKS